MESALIFVPKRGNLGQVLVSTGEVELDIEEVGSDFVEDNVFNSDPETMKLIPGFHFWEGNFVASQEEPSIVTTTLRPATLADFKKFFPELG